MSVPEFVFAPVHATVLKQEGNDLVEESLTPACDFCLDTRTRWEYPCETFTIDFEPIPFGSQDSWLACEACAERIETRDFGGLTARSVKSWVIRNGTMPDVDTIGQIQHGFLDHRQGARIPWKEG